MTGRLEEKIAIITGAGTGMSAVHAVRFAEEGAAVVLAEIDIPSAEKVADEIKAMGGQALAIKTDVSKKAAVD